MRRPFPPKAVARFPGQTGDSAWYRGNNEIQCDDEQNLMRVSGSFALPFRIQPNVCNLRAIYSGWNLQIAIRTITIFLHNLWYNNSQLMVGW